MPFDIAPVQIAFIIIGKSEELFNYYQEIYNSLTPHYRCQLYNKNSRVNLNVLQADKEGCPFKIILGNEELKKSEITLVRRDNVERKVTINLESSEVEKKTLVIYKNFIKRLNEIHGENEKVQKALENKKEVHIDSFQKGEKAGKIIGAIIRERAEFHKNLYQKSVDFRDKHIYPVNTFSELKKKIKEGAIGLFLIPFCNKLDCEEKIKIKVPSYSVRCIALEEKSIEILNCLFCQSVAQHKVYLGRSY